MACRSRRVCALVSAGAAVTTALAILGAPAPAAPPSEESLAAESEIAMPGARNSLDLPGKIGQWTLAGPPRRFDSEALFDYMNGAAELYVGYRFDYLDAYEYGSPDAEDILVELYWMKSSDDAFGLLSNDWSGEPLVLGDRPLGDGALPAFPRALYGSAQLRIWSDNLYARAIAYEETEETRETLVAIGRAVVAGRRDRPPPALMTALPESLGDGFGLAPDRACFLRSHLVLNSFHYLDSKNILNLGPSTEAVLAPYEKPSSAGGESGVELLLLVRYASPASAREALNQFLAANEPEETAADPDDAVDRGYLRTKKDGWASYGVDGRDLALVLGAPAIESARMLIDRVQQQLEDAN